MIRCQLNKSLHGAEGTMKLKFENEISQGEIVGLYGPSGSGKTSILRMIAGLMKPDSGHITVDQDTWYDQNQHINKTIQKRNVGFIFQDYALFPHLNVLQNISFGLSKNDNSNRVSELMELTGLQNLAQDYPTKLSGGQQQRVALCRALAPNPKILLLDEPLSAVDGNKRRHLQDAFKQLHQQYNFTAIMVSHNISELLRVCDRIISIENGTIISDQSIENFSTKNDHSKITVLAEIIKINYALDNNTITVLVGNESHTIPISEDKLKEIKLGSMIPFQCRLDQ